MCDKPCIYSLMCASRINDTFMLQLVTDESILAEQSCFMGWFMGTFIEVNLCWNKNPTVDFQSSKTLMQVTNRCSPMPICSDILV